MVTAGVGGSGAADTATFGGATDAGAGGGAAGCRAPAGGKAVAVGGWVAGGAGAETVGGARSAGWLPEADCGVGAAIGGVLITVIGLQALPWMTVIVYSGILMVLPAIRREMKRSH